MTEELINRNLIEEFLGMEHELVKSMSSPYYDKQYQWIMPVYQKSCEIISSISADLKTDLNEETLLGIFFPRDIFKSPEHVYIAVLIFIRWHNATQNTKNQ